MSSILKQLRAVGAELKRQDRPLPSPIGESVTLVDAESILAQAGLSLAIVLSDLSAAMTATPGKRDIETGSPRTRLFDVKELVAMGLGSRQTIYRNIAKGKLPAPFKSGGRVVWRESTIIAHLDKMQPTDGRGGAGGRRL